MHVKSPVKQQAPQNNSCMLIFAPCSRIELFTPVSTKKAVFFIQRRFLEYCTYTAQGGPDCKQHRDGINVKYFSEQSEHCVT